ncbi:MAG: ANT(3'') family aminoglycoside nucleotidyltransferase [Myxococcales bacterium 68-20]|nr:DUF4111 domain-containing protein [Myxococcales bacterium]OJY22553.1 MAG: ANT(3'') family aminoglycoside nucleotidyltransferase [Myxococcales bacterium 68-20]
MAPTPTFPQDIAAQLSQAQAVLERHLAGNIVALHLFGSAVDEGLRRDSDIDLMATVRVPLAADARRSLMNALLQVSGRPGGHASMRPLEVTIVVHGEVVPWRYPPMRELQFGEWLRKDLEAGVVEPTVVDRDLAILLTKLRQHSVALRGQPAAEVFDPVPRVDFVQALRDTLELWNGPPDWEGDERNVVLALARIWFSAGTGRIASKDSAAAWVLERLPAALSPVLASARLAYLGTGTDDLADRPAEVAEFVRHAKSAIQGVLAAPMSDR